MTSRRLVVLLTVVGVLLPVVAAFAARDGAPLLTFGPTATVFALLGGIILLRRPGHRMGWLYLVIGLEIGVFYLVNTRSLEELGSLAWWQWILGWFAGAGWALGPALAVTFGLLWLPDGRPPSHRWRWVERVTWAAILGVLLVFPLSESPQAVVDTVPLRPDVAEALFIAVALLLFASILTCVASPFARFRGADRRTRQQLLLVGIGGVVGLLIYVTAGYTTALVGPLTHEHTFALAILALPVSTAVAITRYGMLDIGRLLTRTLSYTIVTAVLAAVYATGVLVVGQVVPAEGSDLLVAGSTLAVAALFRPVRTAVRDGVDRRFNRSRYDAEHAVASFRSRLRDELDLGTVSDELCGVVGRTLLPARVGLVIFDQRGVPVTDEVTSSR